MAVPAMPRSCEETDSRSLGLWAHVLNRTGYGPDAWSRARIEQLGMRGYLEEQLHPETIPDEALEQVLRPYETLGLSLREMVRDYGRHAEARAEGATPLYQLTEAKVLRCIMSLRQLETVLVDFWFNHFNVFAPNRFGRYYATTLERDGIRPNVLGRFEDMLVAAAQSPAMLLYLDNRLNTRPGYGSGTGEERGLIENYARELLELHTVGVEAGYSQKDVIEVARCFTGWTIDESDQSVGVWGHRGTGFLYVDEAHDKGAKRIMGQLSIAAGGGLEDGQKVLSFLARHPRTAERVSRRLVERFVSEDAPPELVKRAAASFQETGGNLRAVMRTILFSPEFLDRRNWATKVKRPLVFTASWARATGADPERVLGRARSDLAQLGELPYAAVSPTGYPERSEAWAGNGSLLLRLNILSHVTSPENDLGIEWPRLRLGDEDLVATLGERLLPGGLRRATRERIVARLSTLRHAAIETRVQEAGVLLLSSPDFLYH